MTRYRFTVVGEPVAQPRVKARVIGGHGGVYTPTTANDWKTAVRAAALAVKDAPGPGFTPEEPVSVTLDFRFRRPQGHFGKKGMKPSAPAHHLKKPDFDNLCKSTVDAMVDCGLLSDDKSIVEWHGTKSYALPNEDWGVDIALEVIE